MRRLAAIALTAALLTVGCGDEAATPEARGGSLVWQVGPIAGAPSKLKPADRTVGGTLRNDSFGDLDLEAAQLRLLDGAGREVPGGLVTFASAPGHGLWPIGRINRVPESDQYRIGMKVRLRPGQETPLTVAWVAADGVAAPRPGRLRQRHARPGCGRPLMRRRRRPTTVGP